jgi:PhzF family phenazine biosynthesis protein
MKLPIYTVDAFTDKPFSGNPAAVCITEKPLDEELMKNIASEMNLSETAYLVKTKDGFNLRWFTPSAEVDLCGHATLASSHILWETGVCGKDEPISFHTKSGVLTAVNKGDVIEMDFPAIEQDVIDYPLELETALGIRPVYVGMTKWNYVVELENEGEVRGVEPNYDMLTALPGWGTIITAKADMKGYDFVSRFFAPEKGVKEDPVTGSAHCALGPFWQKRLEKNEFKAYQASQRGGTVGVRVEADRVFLSGNAVTVLKAEMNI